SYRSRVYLTWLTRHDFDLQCESIVKDLTDRRKTESSTHYVAYVHPKCPSEFAIRNETEFREDLGDYYETHMAAFKGEGRDEDDFMIYGRFPARGGDHIVFFWASSVRVDEENR